MARVLAAGRDADAVVFTGYYHSVPDYNGHWGVRELCDICPQAQRALCRDAHRPPTAGQLRRILDELGYDTPALLDGGHLWTHGLTEQQRYPVQHQLGFQVWDLELPHFAHAHGRSCSATIRTKRNGRTWQPHATRWPWRHASMTSSVTRRRQAVYRQLTPPTRTEPARMTPGTQGDWTTAPLIALDLEGSGAQDRDGEAILEIAVVPITTGQPDMRAAYTTLINPGRTIPRRPWISPGLTAPVLAGAPGPAQVEPELARRVDGRAVVGHNVRVDWRLLHRRYPAIAPAALIDTLRLARRLNLDSSNSLGALTARLGLTAQVERLAAGSQPHRALWDSVATALLLPALIARCWPSGATLGALLEAAGIDLAAGPAQSRAATVQGTLFGPLRSGGGIA
jgi:DNA polymerase III epsilon subunit-like protein